MLLNRDHLLHRDCKPHPVRITHAVIGYHHQLHPETQGHEEQEEEEFNDIRGGCSTSHSPRLVSRDVCGLFRTSTGFWLRSFNFGFLPVTPFFVACKVISDLKCVSQPGTLRRNQN